ncbi:hypothetical protein GGS23DRAFT_596465 [Durotheca rogersii]|uniref:uncharacterized protein n=1 Tax=Durotheca rogersii TaxID=419775 RepID=UPI002220A0BE|nr:uncharacterized protein GGS23DRAFT_596465 [Durotheca rogersii]KAI5863983.1 hypothetical protein GGS23DRAFT_596465 [Durotheca rogersii]
MPKRHSDVSTAMLAIDQIPPAKVQKTERSHEENQERAYIAASRRADRSLEARVQSARQASEIHRRRTGRGLKVSEEIVLKEEMYEEEEDDLPRQYKYLTAHLQTGSSDMNHRVNAFVTTQTAMAAVARYNEVNRLFSESFPSATAYRHRPATSLYMAPLANNNGAFSHRLSASDSSPTSPHSRAQSEHSHFGGRDSVTTVSPVSNPATAMSSPSAPTPGSTGPADVPEPKRDPYRTPSFQAGALDPQMAPQSALSSAFTSELPREVKMMTNIGMSDPMATQIMDDNAVNLQIFGLLAGDYSLQGDTMANQASSGNQRFSAYGLPGQSIDMISPLTDSLGPFDIPDDDYGGLGTPGAGMTGDAWESFVDFGAEH